VKVLITGAAGFIGSHLVDRLLSEGHDVLGVDCFDTFYDPTIKEQHLGDAKSHDSFSLIRGDIRDRALFDALPGDIDVVVHLAARAGVRSSIEDPNLYTSVNLGGTVQLLEWMRAADVRRLVFASSSSVYGNNSKVPFSESDPVDHPISPYAATKRSGELLCHTYHHLFGFSILALRFFTVYGPRQRPDLAIHKFARLLLAGEPIPMYGDGSSRRDYTFIDDIIDGVVAAIDLATGDQPVFDIVNLGENRTVSLGEMIETIGEVAGIEPEIERLPMQPGDVERTYADISKARELLSYDPQTGFREGVQLFLDWYEQLEEGI